MLATDLVLGASLALLLFMCTLVNSALTTTIVGNAKAMVTTALGAVLFGRVQLQVCALETARTPLRISPASLGRPHSVCTHRPLKSNTQQQELQ